MIERQLNVLYPLSGDNLFVLGDILSVEDRLETFGGWKNLYKDRWFKWFNGKEE